jgi:glucarate dehydratase
MPASNDPSPAPSQTPRITRVLVIPVAGQDSMLLNLSGAHGPFFTRNLLVLTDSSGRTGVGEVPGGEKIRNTLDDARELIDTQHVAHPLCRTRQRRPRQPDL